MYKSMIVHCSSKSFIPDVLFLCPHTRVFLCSRGESANLSVSACWSPDPFHMTIRHMPICPYAHMPICPYGLDRMIICPYAHMPIWSRQYDYLRGRTISFSMTFHNFWWLYPAGYLLYLLTILYGNDYMQYAICPFAHMPNPHLKPSCHTIHMGICHMPVGHISMCLKTI